MRRLISFASAAVFVAGLLATNGEAMAKDHHDGGGRPEQHGPGSDGRAPGGYGRMPGGYGRMPGGGHGAPPPQAWPGGEYRGGTEYRGDGRWERQEPRRETRPDPRYERRADPRTYAPPPSPYQAAPRRGGYLGPYGGEVIQDPGRYRLRPPPRGYDWVRTPAGMALVSRSTGQVFDVVPY
ncbi:RcnB family protein [Phenylobacterium sp.]|jgi:Ni/Co efflux regulator RcnB|uniref:RcnB family protein n=1 Tax=Phenylobacterium sp. TaxID=1871053 RepID=UPI002F414904